MCQDLKKSKYAGQNIIIILSTTESIKDSGVYTKFPFHVFIHGLDILPGGFDNSLQVRSPQSSNALSNVDGIPRMGEAILGPVRFHVRGITLNQ